MKMRGEGRSRREGEGVGEATVRRKSLSGRNQSSESREKGEETENKGQRHGNRYK